LIRRLFIQSIAIFHLCSIQKSDAYTLDMLAHGLGAYAGTKSFLREPG